MPNIINIINISTCRCHSASRQLCRPYTTFNARKEYRQEPSLITATLNNNDDNNNNNNNKNTTTAVTCNSKAVASHHPPPRPIKWINKLSMYERLDTLKTLQCFWVFLFCVDVNDEENKKRNRERVPQLSAWYRSSIKSVNAIYVNRRPSAMESACTKLNL